jgi:DNA end-binding protein Ku
VNVPVKLMSATRDLGVHFNQLHEKDNSRIEVRRVCTAENEEVPWEEVARGYELESGELIMLTDDELDAADPKKTRTIDIEAFVDLEEIDPVFYDHPYYLVPDSNEAAVRAYHLLRTVMERSGQVAIARFVLRTKEYLVAVRTRGDSITLTTMLFHDEVRPTKDVDTGGRKPAKAQLDAAVKLVEALAADWDPEEYRDCYRERLLDVIERKRKGKKIVAPKSGRDAGGPPPDIMAALKESLERARSGEGFDRDDGDADGDGGNGGGALSDLSRDELYERAQNEDVPGRSSMTRDELIEALSG